MDIVGLDRIQLAMPPAGEGDRLQRRTSSNRMRVHRTALAPQFVGGLAGVILGQMEFATFRRESGALSTPIVAAAVHNGHDLRPEVEPYVALDFATRLREEDPFTDFFAAAFPAAVIANRSRFEVDLNRPRESAVYGNAEDAWGLEVWSSPLPFKIKGESFRLYDLFYDELSCWLDEIVNSGGGFVFYDIHSYNHRRAGPDGPPAPADENPTVNLGTGSLPAQWRSVADTFIDALAEQAMGGELLDVRENVKFRGRQLAAWVHEAYGEFGCALAIELKKVWMDEWTGEVDSEMQSELRDALLATIDPVAEAWRRSGSY